MGVHGCVNSALMITGTLNHSHWPVDFYGKECVCVFLRLGVSVYVCVGGVFITNSCNNKKEYTKSQSTAIKFE